MSTSRSRRAMLIAPAIALGAMLANPMLAPAASLTVAQWGGETNNDASVTSCTYSFASAGATGTFGCGSVYGAAPSTQCTYVTAGLTGVCNATLHLATIHGTVVWTYQQVGQSFVLHYTCAHSANSFDGSGTLDFQPVTGQGSPESVPVTFHISHPGTTTGVETFTAPTAVVMSTSTSVRAPTPIRAQYHGTNVNLSTGALVTVDGYFTFLCDYTASGGTFAGSLSA